MKKVLVVDDDPDTRDIPLLFFSSLVNPGDIVDGKVGGRNMISKSAKPDEVIRRIDDMLG